MHYFYGSVYIDGLWGSILKLKQFTYIKSSLVYWHLVWFPCFQRIPFLEYPHVLSKLTYVTSCSWKFCRGKTCHAREKIFSRFESCIEFVGRIFWATSRKNKTKWHVCPAKTQISLGIRLVWSESFALCMKKALVVSYPLSAQRRLIGCPGWSESSLGTQAILLVLSWGGSFIVVKFVIAQQNV